jgi:hypothetical protein
VAAFRTSALGRGWPRTCKVAWHTSAVCASRRGAQRCREAVRVRCCSLSCSYLVSTAHLSWRVSGAGKDTRTSRWARTCRMFCWKNSVTKFSKPMGVPATTTPCSWCAMPSSAAADRGTSVLRLYSVHLVGTGVGPTERASVVRRSKAQTAEWGPPQLHHRNKRGRALQGTPR